MPLLSLLQGYTSGGGARQWPPLDAAHGEGPGRRSAAPRLLLFTNCSVQTADAAAPRAAAFAVDPATGRFSFVGSAAAAAAAAPAQHVVDLQGATVIPGLCDAHLHLIPGGLSLSRPSLAAVASRAQLGEALAAAAARAAPGQWLLSGAGWDESRWGGEMPSAEWVDAGAPPPPLLLWAAAGGSGGPSAAAACGPCCLPT